jgi:hypothetical protein
VLRASTILSWLLKRRSVDEVARIKAEAVTLFSDSEGRLDLEALANAPRSAREEMLIRSDALEQENDLPPGA